MPRLPYVAEWQARAMEQVFADTRCTVRAFKGTPRHAKAEKLTADHEFAMIQVKNQGQTKLLIAVALYKTGKTPEALATVETAISELTRVQSDETI